MEEKHCWDDLLTDIDRIVIEKGGYGQPRGFGKKPLLLIIDCQPNYVGADKPIEEQLDEWPSGGGANAWESVRRIISLRDVARGCGIRIMYTKNVRRQTLEFDGFSAKTKRNRDLAGKARLNMIREEVHCVKDYDPSILKELDSLSTGDKAETEKLKEDILQEVGRRNR